MVAASPRSPGADARPAAGGFGVPLVEGARLPLAFIAAGLVAYAAAALWLAFSPSLVLQPFLHPRLVALVHLLLPGMLLSIALGAVYQLMPVVVGVALRAGPGALWLHFGLHWAGVPVIVAGFVLGRFAWVAAGGVLVACGVVLVCTATVRTFLASTRRDAVAWCFPLAVGWLTVAVSLGVLMGWNRTAAVLPVSAVALLKAHAHLGLLGFFLSLLQGATFQLVPMFTMAELRRPRWVAVGLGLTQIGLVVLAPGLAFDAHALAMAGAIAVAAGVAATGVALVATLRARRRRVLEPGVQAFVVGAVLAALAVVPGVALLWGGGLPPEVVVAYGVIIIPGVLALTILGMLCKIVPFLVWMRAYGAKVGREPVPLATALASRALERAWLGLHLTALIVIVIAHATGSLFVAAAGCWLFLAAAGTFLSNMARVLRHLGPRAAPVVAQRSQPV